MTEKVIQFRETQIEQAISQIEGAWKNTILPALNLVYGLDLEDPNFDDTPKRIAKALVLEKCRGICPKEKLKELLGVRFPSKYTGMVKVGPIDTVGLCPHHFENVVYKVHFGYIPNNKVKDNVVGLSKIIRFIDFLSRAPILQEDYTKSIVDNFQEYLSPSGCMAVVKGQHGCMTCRGVKITTDCWITTSEVRGEFEICDSIKQEFLKI